MRHFGSSVSAKWKLDASTSYLFLPQVPKRIADHLGEEARVVVILREPLERAVSTYWHMVRNGTERREFEEILNLLTADPEVLLASEDAALATAVATGKADCSSYARQFDDAAWPFRYMSNGLYSQQLSRFLTYFARDDVLVLFTDELRQDPDHTLAKILEFVGVDTDFVPPDVHAVMNRGNGTTGIEKRGLIAAALRASRKAVPRSARKRLHESTGGLWRRLVVETRKKPTIGASVLDGWHEMFSADLDRLEKLAGVAVPPSWRQPPVA